jgi:hypothetical protein
MSVEDEDACKSWKSCDDALRYDTVDEITRLHLAVFCSKKPGIIALSANLFMSITGTARTEGSPLVGIGQFMLYALPSDVEHSATVALKLMNAETACEHNGCTGVRKSLVDDSDLSKKIFYSYTNEKGVTRDLVAHFFHEGGAFNFVIAFASDD